MNDPTVFRLPDLGEGLVEAEIVSWHVGVGDHVTAGQPLLSVETDKAVVEIPSPRSGVVGSLQAAVGDRVAVGAPLVMFGHPGEACAGVVGDLPSAASLVVTPTAEAARAAHAPAVVPERSSAVRAVLASPSVRQLARELGIDLGRVAGTGPDGTILSADVHAALAARDSALAARDSAVAATDKTAVAVTPVRGVRRAMASRMSDAHARVVPATVTDEADIHAWPEGVQPMPRLIRAVAMAAARVPRLNAAFDDRRWELRANPTVDLGIAMETEEGLFVPVIRDVAARSAEDLAGELGELEAAVRARTIAPDRLRGQTLTLSNFGAIAGRFATMVVVPPQVAIVGAGHAMQRPVVDGTQVVIHRVLPLSLTIDHRVVTGAEAGRFLAALIEDLEQAS